MVKNKKKANHFGYIKRNTLKATKLKLGGFCYFTLLVAIKVGIFNSCRRPSPLVSS